VGARGPGAYAAPRLRVASCLGRSSTSYTELLCVFLACSCVRLPSAAPPASRLLQLMASTKESQKGHRLAGLRAARMAEHSSAQELPSCCAPCVASTSRCLLCVRTWFN
jgi:hypothetical protein